MRTRTTIAALVAGACLVALAALVSLLMWLGVVTGSLVAAAAAGAVLVAYRAIVQPWQHHWGATDDEVTRSLPGDEVIPDADATTRAITIDAPPEQVWPWLVQIGYGRAGWYSYDWIDNDGRPSADHIVPELQDLRVGDRIPMLPDFGPIVRVIDPPWHLVSGSREAGTWCLSLARTGDGRTRLVSRWRVRWPRTPAVLFWILISDPGAFIMERRMLLGIKRRAEHATRPVAT